MTRLDHVLTVAFAWLLAGTSTSIVFALGWWAVERSGLGPFWFVAAAITCSSLTGFLVGALTEPNDRRRPRRNLDRRP